MNYSNESVFKVRILKASVIFKILIQLCLKIFRYTEAAVPAKLHFFINWFIKVVTIKQ